MSRRTISMLARRYANPFIGKCIMCRLDYPVHELTDEHIIPLFLSGSGQLIIEQASCRRCQALANEGYEQTVANGEFLIPRLLLDLKRRKKNKQKYLPPVQLGCSDMDGANREWFDTVLLRDDYPQMFTLTTTPPAGLLSGNDQTAGIPWFRPAKISFGPSKWIGDVKMLQHTQLGPTHMLAAKIAYCYGIAERGPSGWRGDDLLDLLMGRRSDVFNFVGFPSRPPLMARKSLHSIRFRIVGQYRTALVSLFDAAGAPPYEVVLGRV